MPPLLSIVIPTRNRPQTAFICATSILRNAGADFEVVVRDCSDSDELRTRLDDLKDPRLVVEHGSPTSMTGNWNAAMRLTSGRYICYIGDDDGFLPWSLDILRALDGRETVDCLASDPLRATYNWPDFSVQAQQGLLKFDKYPKSLKLRRQSARAALKANLSWRRSEIPLPGIYHRIASRSLVEDMKRISGDYFQTTTPDWFTYVLSACILDEYHIVAPNLTMAGSCGVSNSSLLTAGGTEAVLGHIKEFSDAETDFDRAAPFANVQGMLSDTVVKALRLAKDDALLRHFRLQYVPALYAEAMCLNPRDAVRYFLTLQTNGMEHLSMRERFLANANHLLSVVKFVKTHGDFTLRKMKIYQPDKKRHRFEGVRDIGEAIDIVTEVTGFAAPAPRVERA